MRDDIPEHERLGDALDAWTCLLLMKRGLTFTEYSNSIHRNREEAFQLRHSCSAPELWADRRLAP